MRVNFNEGQEIIRDDLNELQQAKERELYDRVLYKMLQNTVDGFFQTSCLVTRVNATTVQVAAGLGIQYDSSQTSPEPTKRPIYVASNTNKTLSAAHASLNRYDIVSIKAARATAESENRRYRASTDSAPTTQSFVTKTDWEADIVVTAGTPHASPSVPSTPAGYIRIATLLITAATGLASSNDITDNRTNLDSVQLDLARTWTAINTFTKQFVLGQYAQASVATPSSGYKSLLLDTDDILKQKSSAGYLTPVGLPASGWTAIVGSEGYCTHATLTAALADTTNVPAGSRILVVSNATINTSAISLNVANLYIEFAPGVTYTAGTSATGLTIAAAGIRIKGGRFSGFTTGISISNTFNNNFITECRFASCTSDVVDNNTTPNNVIFGNITE